MYNDPNPSSHPSLPSTSIDANASVLESGFCPTCNYELTSLPDSGACPECGSGYRRGILRPNPLPGAFMINFAYLWPLTTVVIVSFIYFHFAYGPYAIVGWMELTAVGLLVSGVNGLVQSWRLVKRCGATAVSEESLAVRLQNTSSAASLFFVLCVMVPIFAVGGCLVLVCAGLMS